MKAHPPGFIIIDTGTDTIITILRRSYYFRHVLSNRRIHSFANTEELVKRRDT